MDTFQVIKEHVKVLDVTVLRATGVTVSNLSDKFDIPDPYVILRNINSPNAKQKTSVKDDDINPTWNETFTFYLNVEKKNTLALVVKDKNVGVPDSAVGKATVELDDLPIDETVEKVVPINKKTLLYIKLLVKLSENKDLRFSRELCDDEIDFLRKRKEQILKNMQTVLPKEKAPQIVDEVPVIAILGSGGGYRATCGLSGAFCALEETGILDCATYIMGLSGASWYISTLYSYEGWPYNATCEDVGKSLKKRFDTKLSSHFRYGEFRTALKSKRNMGQPVTMTDLMGMAVGDALLQNKESKFSNQRIKLDAGKVALPICTALRVEKEVSAETFSEWMEFSPYEFGIANHGVFGKMSHFGSKFYKGHLVTKYDEAPLHYLQGIWGSAFSILLNRVIGEDSSSKEKKSTGSMAKEYFINNEIDLIGEGDKDVDSYENEVDYLPKEKAVSPLKKLRSGAKGLKRYHAVRRKSSLALEELEANMSETMKKNAAVQQESIDDDSQVRRKSSLALEELEANMSETIKKNAAVQQESIDDDSQANESFINIKINFVGEGDENKNENEIDNYLPRERIPSPLMKIRSAVQHSKGLKREHAVRQKSSWEELMAAISETNKNGAVKQDTINNSKVKKELAKEKKKEKNKASQKTLERTENYNYDDDDERTTEDKVKKRFWLKQIFVPGKLFKSRQGRAAEVLNMFRGLKFSNQIDGEVQTQSIYTKTMCLVDSGLSFNSPYPAAVRPERNVDLILSFDFSQRDLGDNSPPFEELIKAEKWAQENHIPFPSIADNPVTKETDDIRECYVFENPDDPRCPTVMHFVLINKSFKQYKAPGVLRLSNEEKVFGDFPIFDDPAQPYSSFTFQYNGQTFDRLHKLMKYNTLLNIDLIKEKISDRVKYRRETDTPS